MTGISKTILSIGFCIGITSIVYFLSLVVSVPYLLYAIIAAAIIIGFNLFIFRTRPYDTDNISWLIVTVFGCGLLFINDTIPSVTEKYGLWDAWSIWNFDVKYLSDSNNWRQLFETQTLAHPDYPFALPAIIAFLQKLFHSNYNLQIQFILHYIITISIPTIILFELSRKSKLISIIAFSLFAFSTSYLQIGLSQLADTLLAFFLLLALISYYESYQNKYYLALSTFFIGCCMWTKNEGIAISGVFILFNWKYLFQKANYKLSLIGLLLPLITTIIFKTHYAPANDIVSAQGSKTLSYLTDPARYKLIFNSLIDTYYHQFYYFSCFILVYIARCIWKRQLPTRHFNMLVICGGIYFGVYLVNHNELEWQLFTSTNRLIQQLLPSFVYVIALQFADSSSSRFQVRFFSNR